MELSIVLVIIGLIMGGILGGQELIRASELRKIMADKDKYQTAYNAFRIKYNALPGDMKNATSYWGTASGGCPIGARSGTQTCNGNGDGLIGIWDDTDPQCTESLLATQHLALAGILPGNYTGYSSVGGTYMGIRLGVNLQDTGFNNATYMFITPRTPLTHYFSVNTGIMLLFGMTDDNVNPPAKPALVPMDAKNIDLKMDDGMPGTGKVMAPRLGSAYAPSCTTTTVVSTSDYAITNSNILCSLAFINM